MKKILDWWTWFPRWDPEGHRRTLEAREWDRRWRAGLWLCGDTLPIYREIREAGGIWESWVEGWLLPDEPTIRQLGGLPDPRGEGWVRPWPSGVGGP